mmetsp:Transcript_19449/g.22313  ORF Transcript_19449/g.22313 Transcript_19449/m.22313 type:complete len:89 (+) Transcript_19449:729-995(+)
MTCIHVRIIITMEIDVDIHYTKTIWLNRSTYMTNSAKIASMTQTNIKDAATIARTGLSYSIIRRIINLFLVKTNFVIKSLISVHSTII